MAKRKPKNDEQPIDVVTSEWSMLFGRWQDRLPTQTFDVAIGDAPYGDRVHASEPTRADGVDTEGLAPTYAPWTADDVGGWISSWSPRINGWMVNMTSDDLITPHRDFFEDAGRVHFVLPVVIKGMTCRMQGDGPSSEAVYIVLARPRTKQFASWGTKRGFYEGNSVRGSSGGRGKPDWLLHALVRDYSAKGDRIVDCFAGWGSTLRAAVANGRTAVGCEMDRAAFDEGVRQLRNGVQPDLLAMAGVA